MAKFVVQNFVNINENNFDKDNESLIMKIIMKQNLLLIMLLIKKGYLRQENILQMKKL